MTKKKTTCKNKPGAGRPYVVLDVEQIGQLALDGCKNSEIAFILGCDDETLKNNYSPILNKKRAERKAAFRKRQTFQALHGDTTMLIWLGKNELDQLDKQAVEHSGEIKTNDPLIVKVVFVKEDGKPGNGDGNGGNGHKAK